MAQITTKYLNKKLIERVRELLILPKHSLENTSVMLKHVIKIGNRQIVLDDISVGVQETYGERVGFELFGININELHISIKRIYYDDLLLENVETSKIKSQIFRIYNRIFSSKQ